MTSTSLAPRSGVARVTTLEFHPGATGHRPQTTPAAYPVATATVQGTLALDLEPERLPARPVLTLMPGARAELDRFVQRFARAVVEVVSGDRGVQQLLRWTSEPVYADLSRRTSAMHRATPVDQRVRRLRAQVRSVRMFCPTALAAEVSIHVRHGERSRAIAARIEDVDGQWRCTALQFG